MTEPKTNLTQTVLSMKGVFPIQQYGVNLHVSATETRSVQPGITEEDHYEEAQNALMNNFDNLFSVSLAKYNQKNKEI